MLLQVVKVKDGIGDIWPQVRHLFLGKNVAPRELHKSTVPRQAGQAGLNEAFTGQAVQHNINPDTVRSLEDFLTKRGCAAVENMFDAKRAKVGAFTLARCGEYLCACGLGQLNRGKSHTSRTGMNQHPVAFFQSGQLE